MEFFLIFFEPILAIILPIIIYFTPILIYLFVQKKRKTLTKIKKIVIIILLSISPFVIYGLYMLNFIIYIFIISSAFHS